MEEQQIRSLVQDEIRGSQQNALYDTSNTVYHVHNNIDSPPIQRTVGNGNFLIVSDGTTSVKPTDEIDFIGAAVSKSNQTATVKVNRFVLYRVLAPTTTDAVGTVVGGDFVMPFTGALTSVGATVDTAGTTGTTQFDIKKNGSSILSTKITLDSTEKTSRTAATPPVISSTTFSTGDIYTFNIDTVQTTPALGLTFFLNATQTT